MGSGAAAQGGRRRGGGGLLLAGLVAVASAGCSAGAGDVRAPAAGGAASRGPASPGPASPSAAKALEASARQIRSQVDALVEPIVVRSVGRSVIVNDAGPCGVGASGAWPQRWGYAVLVTLRTTNSTSDALALRRRLGADGWSLRAGGGTTDAVDFDARKSGVLLRVSGEPNPARVSVEAYGACVAPDGSLGAS